jgi:hypothetical protein
VDLDLVDQHGRQARLERTPGRDPFAFRPDQGKRARLLRDGVDVLERPVGLAFGDEKAQAADDLPGPARLLDRLVEQADEAARALPGAPLDQRTRGLRIVDDRPERLIELMRQG